MFQTTQFENQKKKKNANEQYGVCVPRNKIGLLVSVERCRARGSSLNCVYFLFFHFGSEFRSFVCLFTLIAFCIEHSTQPIPAEYTISKATLRVALALTNGFKQK